MNEQKMKDEKPTLRQNQKSCNPTHKANAVAAHLLLPQPHDNLTFDNLKLIQRNKCQEQRKKAIGFP
jgi:hypothetical protein